MEEHGNFRFGGLGIGPRPGFAKYRHFLNWAIRSPRALSKHLFLLLLHHFDSAQGPPVFAIDETQERRRGLGICARGIYRDAVARSYDHLVKAIGLRWACLMWLTHIPCTHQDWAFLLLAALAPSEGYHLQ